MLLNGALIEPHLAGRLEKRMSAYDIRFDERGGSADRAVDMRLSGEVHNGVEPLFAQQTFNQGGVADISVYEAKPRSALQRREAHPITCIGERIENDQPVTLVV